MHWVSLMIVGMLSTQHVNWMARMVGMWKLSHNSKGGGGRGVGEDLKCYECGEPGHFAREFRLRIGSRGLGNGQRRSPSPRRRRSPSYGMDEGAMVRVGEDLLGTAVYHLVMIEATAGHLHIVIVHLMLMGIKAGREHCTPAQTRAVETLHLQLVRHGTLVQQGKEQELHGRNVVGCMKKKGKGS
ncbi:hypothetical protein REPUB_Repub18cG0034600 [Reevesia pubescens]